MLKKLVRQVLGVPSEVSTASGDGPEAVLPSAGRFEIVFPPKDVHDAGGWDKYWRDHIERRAVNQAVSDWMSSDPLLPELLTEYRCRTILCAGNGLSAEAYSLARLGFSVTALDISSMPAAGIDAALQDPEHLHRLRAFRAREGIMGVAEPDPNDTDAWRVMHCSAKHPPKGGGALTHVTGDLMDSAVCQGPFDAVIERRTVQLFAPEEQALALERLVGRLGRTGVFVTHQHNGGWTRGEPLTHFAEGWLESRGFVVLRSASVPGHRAHLNDDSARIAWVVLSTG